MRLSVQFSNTVGFFSTTHNCTSFYTRIFTIALWLIFVSVLWAYQSMTNKRKTWMMKWRIFQKKKILNFQVHQRQTERMRHRSEWFLSDPSTGLVTVKCRPSSMVMPIPPASPLDSTGPPSLPSSRPPPLPSSQPPTRMGRLSPNVSCDKMMMSITPGDHPSSPLPKSGPNSTPKGTPKVSYRASQQVSDIHVAKNIFKSQNTKNLWNFVYILAMQFRSPFNLTDFLKKFSKF